MPGTTLPPSQSQSLDGLYARVERIERQTRNRGNGTGVFPPLVFTYPGLLDNDVESPPWYPGINMILLQIRISLLAAATVDHTVEVRVDGVALAQYTLPSGQLTALEAIGIPVNASSYLTIKTIDVTDENLSVEFEQRAR